MITPEIRYPSRGAVLLQNMRRLARRNDAVLRALATLAAYVAWIALFRLLVLTSITYFLQSSSPTPLHPTRFEEINDAFSGNEITVMGLAPFFFMMMIRWLNPLSDAAARPNSAEGTAKRFGQAFLPGFAHGSVLAGGMIVAFAISGVYRYLGSYIPLDEIALALASVALRAFALAALAYSEEFLFRGILLARFRSRMAPLAAIALTSLLYCAVKTLQFDPSWMQLGTLFLVSVALSLRALADGDFCAGAGFWAALLIVFHPLLSLPIFGDDFSGLLLVKYPGTATGAAGATTRFLAGGAGGPLASFALQFLLILDIARHIARGALRSEKSLLKPPSEPI